MKMLQKYYLRHYQHRQKVEYQMKNYRTAWNVSLLVIACISLLMLMNGNVGLALPDNMIRVMGILDMCAVVVLVYTSVKLRIWEKK